jgi:hypothetical protein
MAYPLKEDADFDSGFQLCTTAVICCLRSLELSALGVEGS